MSLNLLVLTVILSPAAFFITSLVSRFEPGNSILVKQLSKFATNYGLIIAAMSGILVFKYGHLQTDLLGFKNLGFSLRLDVLSAIMLTMIALLGFIISKFSFAIT